MKLMTQLLTTAAALLAAALASPGLSPVKQPAATSIHAGLRLSMDPPTNNKLDAGISRIESLGDSLNLWCDSRTEEIESCEWLAPDGHIYVVEGDHVVPEGDGEVIVPERNLMAADDDDGVRSCRIAVPKTAEHHMGDWECSLKLKNVEQVQFAVLVATVDHEILQDFRLHGHLVPDSYEVHLTPFIVVGNFTIEGHVTILVNIAESPDMKEADRGRIKLHVRNIDIHENTVNVVDVSDSGRHLSYGVVGHGYDAAREFYIIRLDEPLQPGTASVRIVIGFLAQLSDGLSGFYRSSYNEFVDGKETVKKYLATTQFEATAARMAFPCFDEPGMKASFSVKLGRLPNMTAISNMPKSSSGLPMADNDEYVWDEFFPTPKMSTYLLAFVVSDFDHVVSPPLPDTNNNVTFRIWSRPLFINKTRFAADAGPRVLSFFEEYFNKDFPLQKEDMIAIPDFSAGAMENWGLVTYREEALLYDPESSNPLQKENIASIISHELAHQWFGNLVTMKWWSDLWLNEGFATYVSYLGVDHVLPENGMSNRFTIREMHRAFGPDSYDSTHTVSAQIQKPEDISSLFDAISYSKGASIVRMMSNFIGQEAFMEGLIGYLENFEYSNANQQDLWDAFSNAGWRRRTLRRDVNVAQVMNSWTLEKGYPVISVNTMGCCAEKHEVVLDQQKFSMDKDITNGTARWWVPVSYTTAGSRQFNQTLAKIWLTPNDDYPVTYPIPDCNGMDALVINVQQTGYYRVNYDEHNWRLIAEAKVKDKDSIHEVSRVQLLDDAFHLATVGLLPYELALDQTLYLDKEYNYAPWKPALFSLDFIGRMLGRTSYHFYFNQYMVSKLKNIYWQFNLEGGQQTSQEVQGVDELLLTSIVLSAMKSLEYLPMIQASIGQFKKWMDQIEPDLYNPIHIKYRSNIYCFAISQGTVDEWEFLWKRYQGSSSSDDQKRIISALGCSRSIPILQRYLKMSLNEKTEIKKQNGCDPRIVISVANSQIGRDLVWDWIQEDWEKIYNCSSSSIHDIISVVSRDFNTKLKAKQLRDFYEDNTEALGTAKGAVEQAIQKTDKNLKWMEKYSEVVGQWFQNNVKQSSLDT